MTIGFLPENITSNDLFIRVFEYHIFEVQAAELPHTYITKYSYHDGRVNYKFYFNEQTNELIIEERHIQTKEIFQLIPHTCFQKELPDAFVTNHSHWWNAHKREVEFRSIHFKDADFLNSKSYVLSMDTRYITTLETNQKRTLINQSSKLFKNLFERYFSRLDEKPYVYMMSEGTFVVYLSRLKIAFQYNESTGLLISREYSDMCVSEDQHIGTLIGLKSGLLLSALPVNNHPLDRYQCRKLIVPFGELQAKTTSDNDHHIVRIKRTTDFVHQYFVFILNDRLKILQSTDSPTGCLYLSLLHAMTSHPLPDRYTGLTGMERSFQLLNSAACYSDQSFDQLSLHILGQIAAISPKVDYYPTHLTCMQEIQWNTHSLPHSLQHFGYYLIAKNLIDISQQFSYMYPSDTLPEIPEIFTKPKNNEQLLKKLYWDYRNSYNPLARLSPEMEADILKTSNTDIYQLDSTVISRSTNYKRIHLIDDLYNSGPVHLRDISNQHWLPLSQWLENDNQLKNIWIGLLKMAINLKMSSAAHSGLDFERFNKLLDFLHYISGKMRTNPFYLQMLKTALNSSNISSQVLTLPSFGFCANIESSLFLKQQIRFLDHYHPSKRNEILTEVEKSFSENRNYENKNGLVTPKEITRINPFLTPWWDNRNLRIFFNLA